MYLFSWKAERVCMCQGWERYVSLLAHFSNAYINTWSWAKSLDLFLDLLHGWQKPKYLSCHLPPRLYVIRKLELVANLGLEPQHSDAGCEHPKGCLNYHAEYPPFSCSLSASPLFLRLCWGRFCFLWPPFTLVFIFMESQGKRQVAVFVWVAQLCVCNMCNVQPLSKQMLAFCVYHSCYRLSAQWKITLLSSCAVTLAMGTIVTLKQLFCWIESRYKIAAKKYKITE